jgi:hypothetical protein
MRTYSALFFLLSFFTIFLSLNSRLFAYGTTPGPTSTSSHQLLAAQTQTGRNLPPDRGKPRRNFNQLQEIGFPRLL